MVTWLFLRNSWGHPMLVLKEEVIEILSLLKLLRAMLGEGKSGYEDSVATVDRYINLFSEWLKA
jgi:hypothetical protein